MTKKTLAISSIRVIILVTIGLLICLSSISQGMCANDSDNIWIIENENEGKPAYDLSMFGDKVGEVYELVLKIATPCAVIPFAMGAYKMLTGNDQDMKAGQKQMKLVLMALAALYLLPIVVRAGIDIGDAYKWSPP